MGNISNLTKRISLNNQPSMTPPIIIDLNPDEYNQGLCYEIIMVELVGCNGSCNTLDDSSSRICLAKIQKIKKYI